MRVARGVASAAVLLLAACGDKKSEPPKPQPTGQPSPDPAPAARKPALPTPVADSSGSGSGAGSGSGSDANKPEVSDGTIKRQRPSALDQRSVTPHARFEKMQQKKAAEDAAKKP